MKAVVLVGGFGTRLRPLTLTTPKQMLPIGDRPMIEHVVGRLGAFGVDEVVLSMGYRPDAFRQAYPDDRCAGVRLRYAVDPEPLDTAGAIRYAARAGAVDETFLALNGDVITTLDLDALLDLHRSAGAEATITLSQVEDPSRYGVVPTDESGRVLGFVEKPPRDEAPTDWINAGTYVLEPSVLDRIPEGPVSIERQTFPELAELRRLYAYQANVYWVDTGTPASYVQVQLDLLDGSWGEGIAAIGPGASVADDAVIERSLIMSDATVGRGAHVTNSIVSPGAVVEAGAIVDGSIVGLEAVVGERAELRELTVIGERVRVPEASRLAGARVPDETGISSG